jgi:hypothetical protein
MLKNLIILLAFVFAYRVEEAQGSCGGGFGAFFGNSGFVNQLAGLFETGNPFGFGADCSNQLSGFASVLKTIDHYDTSFDKNEGSAESYLVMENKEIRCEARTLTAEDVAYYNNKISINEAEDSDNAEHNARWVALQNNNHLCDSTHELLIDSDVKLPVSCTAEQLRAIDIPIFTNRPYQEDALSYDINNTGGAQLCSEFFNNIVQNVDGVQPLAFHQDGGIGFFDFNVAQPGGQQVTEIEGAEQSGGESSGGPPSSSDGPPFSSDGSGGRKLNNQAYITQFGNRVCGDEDKGLLYLSEYENIQARRNQAFENSKDRFCKAASSGYFRNSVSVSDDVTLLGVPGGMADNTKVAGWGCKPDDTSGDYNEAHDLCRNDVQIANNNGDFIENDKVYMWSHSSYEKFQGYIQKCNTDNDALCSFPTDLDTVYQDENEIIDGDTYTNDFGQDITDYSFLSSYHYEVITSGTCADGEKITQLWRCKLAASVTHMAYVKSIFDGAVDDTSLPSGCIENNEGFLVYNTAVSTAKECSEDTPCICKKEDDWCLDGECTLPVDGINFTLVAEVDYKQHAVTKHMSDVCQSLYLFSAVNNIHDPEATDKYAPIWIFDTEDVETLVDIKKSAYFREIEGVDITQAISDFKNYYENKDNNISNMFEKAENCFHDTDQPGDCSKELTYLKDLFDCSCGFVFSEFVNEQTFDNILNEDHHTDGENTDGGFPMYPNFCFSFGLLLNDESCMSTIASCKNLMGTCDNKKWNPNQKNEVYIDCGGLCEKDCKTEDIRFVNNNWYSMINYWYNKDGEVDIAINWPPSDLQERNAVDHFLKACNAAVNDIFGVTCVKVTSNSRPHLSGLTITFGGNNDNLETFKNVVNPLPLPDEDDSSSTYSADSWIWLTSPCPETKAFYPDDDFDDNVDQLTTNPNNWNNNNCVEYRLYEGLLSTSVSDSNNDYKFFKFQYDIGLDLSNKDHIGVYSTPKVTLFLDSNSDGGLKDSSFSMTQHSTQVGLYEVEIPKSLFGKSKYEIFFNVHDGETYSNFADGKLYYKNGRTFGAPLQCRGDTLFHVERSNIFDSYISPPQGSISKVQNNVAWSYNLVVNSTVVKQDDVTCSHTAGDLLADGQSSYSNGDTKITITAGGIINNNNVRIINIISKDGSTNTAEFYSETGILVSSYGATCIQEIDHYTDCISKILDCTTSTVGTTDSTTNEEITESYASIDLKLNEFTSIRYQGTATEPLRLCTSECRCKIDFCSAGVKSQDGQVCCHKTRFTFGAEDNAFDCKSDEYNDVCDPQAPEDDDKNINCYNAILNSQNACHDPSDTNCILGPNNALGCQGSANAMLGVVPNTCVLCNANNECLDAYCQNPSEVFDRTQGGCVDPSVAFENHCQNNDLFNPGNCSLWPILTTSLIEGDQSDAIAVRATAPFETPFKMLWRFWIDDCVALNEPKALANLDILPGKRSSCESCPGDVELKDGCSTCQWRQTIGQIQSNDESCFNKQATFGVSEVFMVEITAYLVSLDLEYADNDYESVGAHSKIQTRMFSKKGYKLMVRKRTIVTGSTNTNLKAVLETSIMSVDFQHDIVLNIFTQCPDEDGETGETKTALTPGEPVQLQVSVDANSGINTVDRIEVETFKQMGRYGLEFVFIAGGVEKYDQMFARFLRLGAKPCIEFIPMSQVKYNDNTATFYVSGILVIGTSRRKLDNSDNNNMQQLFKRRLQDSASNQEAEVNLPLLDVPQTGNNAAVDQAQSENQMQSKKFPFVATLVVVASVVITAALIVLGIVVHAASSSSDVSSKQ